MRLAKFILSVAATTMSVPGAGQSSQTMSPPADTAGEIEEDGTVLVGGFRLPPSIYLSEEAAASLPREARDQMALLSSILNAPDPSAIRPMAARSMAPMHDMMRQTYGVRTEAGEIAGVSVVWAIPENAPAANAGNVLINFPGGGFVAGTAAGTGMTESIPVAGLAGVRVVSISYRQAPEHRFPAASEDSTAVYRELLETYGAENIGIFGCSAGGALAAQSIAWYLSEGLPLPAAVGIFCSSADRFGGGDSMNFARPFQGLAQQEGAAITSYFEGSDESDPLVSPIEDSELLAQFPPSLLITATRAMELSAAVNTHRELVKAGVQADLHVWDGLGHAFFYDPTLPESQEAYEVMANFFAEHLALER